MGAVLHTAVLLTMFMTELFPTFGYPTKPTDTCWRPFSSPAYCLRTHTHTRAFTHSRIHMCMRYDVTTSHSNSVYRSCTHHAHREAGGQTDRQMRIEGCRRSSRPERAAAAWLPAWPGGWVGG
eukprot:GHVU01141834.1.p1 GENE.GHVU01141834.1~~GHVU01141834.1.p1  ORF type:complete len:123 (+),score=5.19 GHVU01141834.1:502-870(+)